MIDDKATQYQRFNNKVTKINKSITQQSQLGKKSPIITKKA